MCDGRFLTFQDEMEVWPCFWATLMFVTLVTAASNSTCADGTLVLHYKYFRHLRDCHCSESYLNLRTIKLVNNNVFSLQGTGLSDVTRLLHLQVVHNLLTSLDPDLLSNLTELIFIDLSYNQLEAFNNERTFASQNKLQTLILSHNRISTLDLRVLAPLHALKQLSLSENPFCCDCELSHTVKWCEERNLSTGATCENGVPWTDVSYENCTSVTFILIGVGIGTVIIVSVVVEVWVCYSRRTRPATYGPELACSEDTSYNVYRAIPNNYQTCPNSCSADALLLQTPDSSASLEYAPFTQRQGIHHTEYSSKPGTEARVVVSPTYEEPYRHSLNASGTYAVPYQHQNHTTAKTAESKISDENVFVTESNNEVYSEEVYVRNSLYLKQ
jgi:hypothetical protein